jgi:hypothetical protein
MKASHFILFIVIIIIALFGWQSWSKSQPGPLDSFAQCLADEEATFYGAFWCPHCADQKEMFGNSEKYLSYVECSTPDGQSQTAECTDAGITGYPTWEFADGSRENGVVPLEKLAEKTGCELPE